MDIVVNTPHGDADVSIVAHGPDATLADLLVMVTGQAVPLLADVDGHPVRCSTVLDRAGLAMGSVVTTEPVPPEPATESEIALVQLTGSGSGRSVRLGPGRYRIGPGRRLSADELHEAPVETAAFELTVDAADSPSSSGSMPRVEVAAADLEPLLLDATAVQSATPWNDEYLTAANRVFLLDGSPAPASRSVEAPDDDGLIPFHRPPRRHPRTNRRPVIDAVTDAALATAELWAQRSGQRGAFVVPIGMRSTDGRPTEVTLDLVRSPVVAVTGNDRFRTALARTIIVELATLHGPADLDIAIVPGPDRTAAWEWAKWLPHIRLGGDPMIHRVRRDVTDWAARLVGTPWGPGHLTLVVVDDRAQWTVPGSPLRDLMAAAPEGLRVLALCERERDAPSEATVIVSGPDAGSARLDLLDGDADAIEFLPSLIDTDTARIAAQNLAPLLDIEIPPRSAAAPAGPPPADPLPVEGANDDLARLLGPTSLTAEEIRTRWRSVGPATVAVGFRDGQLVTLDLDEAGDILVTGATIDAAVDCAATIAIGLAAIRPPGALWMSAVTSEPFPQLQAIGRLPHAAVPTEGPVDVHRVVARVEALLGMPTGPSHLLIVVPLMSGSGAAPLLDGDAIGSLLEASARLQGLHVIVATDQFDGPMHDVLGSHVATTIRIATSTTGRRATLGTTPAAGDDDDSTAAFSPYEPLRLVTANSIELRPAVIGRQLTPLERRLARAARRSSTDIDPAMNAVVDVLCDAAVEKDLDPPVLIPAPLITSIDAGEFFRTHQGDGVPIGMIDDVRDALTRPLWWEPGSGPLVLFGSRRSGVDAVITTVLSGIVDRFAPADVQVAAIESSERRRSALGAVEHVRAVAAPDSPQDMSALLDVVAEALASPGDARLVVVVGDLALVRRELGALTERFDELLAAASGEDSGIDLIVYAGDRSTAGPLWHDGVRCLVGSSSDAAELSAFDITDLRSLDVPGRCRRFPGGELVQLATSGVPLETILIGDAP